MSRILIFFFLILFFILKKVIQRKGGTGTPNLVINIIGTFRG